SIARGVFGNAKLQPTLYACRKFARAISRRVLRLLNGLNWAIVHHLIYASDAKLPVVIGHLYPAIAINKTMLKDRPDLKPYEGEKLTVIAWLWARTVKSPNPAFSNIAVPLASTFMLSSKPGKE